MPSMAVVFYGKKGGLQKKKKINPGCGRKDDGEGSNSNRNGKFRTLSNMRGHRELNFSYLGQFFIFLTVLPLLFAHFYDPRRAT